MTIESICREVFDLPWLYTKDTGPDYWKTPDESCKTNPPSGDCEDYAVYVWRALVDRGVPENKIALYWHPHTKHISHISTVVEDGGKFWCLDVLGYEVYQITLEDIREIHGDRWRFVTKDTTNIPQWTSCLIRMGHVWME